MIENGIPCSPFNQGFSQHLFLFPLSFTHSPSADALALSSGHGKEKRREVLCAWWNTVSEYVWVCAAMEKERHASHRSQVVSGQWQINSTVVSASMCTIYWPIHQCPTKCEPLCLPISCSAVHNLSPNDHNTDRTQKTGKRIFTWFLLLSINRC